MSDADGMLIAVDWGTTNRRIYVVAPDGSCAASISDGMGVLSVPPGAFETELAALRTKLGTGPMLLAGMIGSNRGWKEVPYLQCPASFVQLRSALSVLETRDAAIVPGLSYVDGERGDFMRGEELQILGAVETGLCPPDALVCHPGTHAKWARLEGGVLTGFRTLVTGELFSLLCKHSILSPQLQADAQPDADFLAGVKTALSSAGLAADLFSVRAGALLGLRRWEAVSYVSGLLIGNDVRIGLDFVGTGQITLIGDPGLTGLYAAALDSMGRGSQLIDGETAFVAGAHALWEKLP